MESSSITNLKFVKSVEIVPTKNLDSNEFADAAKILSSVAHVVTAPENPMGLPGVDPILTTYLLAREYDLIAMPHITPRDKNRLYIHSQVLTALKVGIRNFFVIGGDPIHKRSNSREVREMDVLETISSIRGTGSFLNADLPGIGIGSAFNPYRANEETIVARKIESGTNFFISQVLFEPSHLAQDWIKNRNFHLSAGFMPIYRKSQLEFLKKIGVRISDETLKKLDNSDDILQSSVKLILDTFDAAREYVDGIHIMPMGKYDIAKQILESI